MYFAIVRSPAKGHLVESFLLKVLIGKEIEYSLTLKFEFHFFFSNRIGIAADCKGKGGKKCICDFALQRN